MTTFASLPMYDWPEVKDATDALWSALADAFRTAGLSPPAALMREDDESCGWDSPDMFFSQTCGLPFRLRLAGKVTLLATPDYDLNGVPAGYYRSALIAANGDDRDSFAQFKGASYGYNALDSQSGFKALKDACIDFGGLEAHLGTGVKTGAHRSSVRAVARGTVELAAIDAVSWHLARNHEPDAQHVKVVGWTKPTPGLPFIAANGVDADAYRAAIPKAIAALAPHHRAALHLKGCVVLPQTAYLS